MKTRGGNGRGMSKGTPVSANTNGPPVQDSANEITMYRDGEVEDGSPEGIRRWFFPYLPSSNASTGPLRPRTTASVNTGDLYCSLNDASIPLDLVQTPTIHLKPLRHMNIAARSGYTLDDMLSLSRSTARA